MSRWTTSGKKHYFFYDFNPFLLYAYVWASKLFSCFVFRSYVASRGDDDAVDDNPSSFSWSQKIASMKEAM